MKKNIILFLFSLMAIPYSFSQEDKGGERKHFDLEKFKAEKMAYLIQAVGITPEESAQLFPLYNEMQEKRFKLMMPTRAKARELRKNPNAAGGECLKVVDEILDKQIEEAAIEKAYYQKFKKILSPQKLLKLKQADMHFAREVLRRNDNRQPKPNEAK